MFSSSLGYTGTARKIGKPEKLNENRETIVAPIGTRKMQKFPGKLTK